MQRQAALRSEISHLHELITKKHLTLNTRVLEDDTDSDHDQHDDHK